MLIFTDDFKVKIIPGVFDSSSEERVVDTNADEDEAIDLIDNCFELLSDWDD